LKKANFFLRQDIIFAKYFCQKMKLDLKIYFDHG